MPTIIIHNSQTGEITETEMSADELKRYEADVAKEKAKNEAKKAAEEAKAALLAKLGITEEEAKLLLA